jgi:pyruvate/2-oxoglutarate dehydrogenase complex dihydrolipoamide acyltransferase (E2) component
MLTTFNEVNMTPINTIRNEYKDAFKAKHNGIEDICPSLQKRLLELYNCIPT